MNAKNDNFETLIYEENGQSVEVLIRKEDGSAWMTRKEISKLFGVSPQSLSICMKNMITNGEVDPSVGKEFLLTAADGKNYKTKLFDLTTVMAIGFRRKTGIVTKLSSWIRDSARKKSPENSFVIIYDNGEVNLDVRFTPEGDDVWLTKTQMAILFGTTRQNVSLHIENILEDDELDIGATRKYFLQVQPEGDRNVTRELECFNLDMILAVGARVRSKKASEFRRWAYDVLKQYLRNGYVIDSSRLSSTKDCLEHLQKEVVALKEQVQQSDEEIKQRLSKLELLAERGEIPPASAFFVGELFDAREFFHDLFASAKKRIVVVDPYADHALLSLLSSKGKEVHVLLIHGKLARLSKEDIASFFGQYGNLEVRTYDDFHDRFAFIDEDCYHIGSSFNRLGARISIVTKMEESPVVSQLRRLIESLKENAPSE